MLTSLKNLWELMFLLSRGSPTLPKRKEWKGYFVYVRFSTTRHLYTVLGRDNVHPEALETLLKKFFAILVYILRREILKKKFVENGLERDIINGLDKHDSERKSPDSDKKSIRKRKLTSKNAVAFKKVSR